MRRLAIACFVLGCANDTKDLERQRDEAVLSKEVAEKTAAQAVKDAREAIERVEMLEKGLEELGKRVDDAIASLTAFQNDADRASAKSKLEQLRKEQAEMQQRAAAAKASATKAERAK